MNDRTTGRRQGDWLDAIYDNLKRTGKRVRWLDPDYPDAGLRAFTAMRMAARRGSFLRQEQEAAVAEVARAEDHYSALQRDWIRELEQSVAFSSVPATLTDGRDAGKQALVLDRIAYHTVENTGLMEEAGVFLSGAGKADLSQRLGLWCRNCAAENADIEIYAAYALMVSPRTTVVDRTFFLQAMEVRAAEYLRENKERISLLRGLNKKPLTLYKGWESDLGEIRQLIDVYKPVTLERSFVVDDARVGLDRHAAPCAAAFGAFADRLHRLRCGESLSSLSLTSGGCSPSGPIPALP